MQKTIFAAHSDVSDCDDQQKHVLASLERRAVAGQIDRRGFLQLASAIGIGSAFAAAMADRAMASPQVQGQGGDATSRLPMIISSWGPVPQAA
jgi:hypothetical protein